MRRKLWAAGQEAYTPSLTGVGERVHLTGPGVGLTTHVADVVNHVLYEDLDDLVLVGFSYGGAVVTAALPHLAERVAASSPPRTQAHYVLVPINVDDITK